MVLELVAAAALLAANAFFVATEFAITRLRATQVDEFESEGRASARSLRHAVTNIDAYLSACQLGITAASLGLGVVGERAFHKLLEPVVGHARIFSIGLAGLLAFLIITTLHVVVGELAPKSLAIARNEATAVAVARPIRLFYLVTQPLVDIFNWLGNLLLKPFGIPPAREAGHAPHTEAELRSIVRESAQEGLIERDERKLAERVFTFGDRRVREIMLPRSEIEFLTVGSSVTDAARYADSTGHTRFPLCEADGGVDAAVGIVNAKDLLTPVLTDEEKTLQDMARPIHRVPDGMLIDELLRDLRRERSHLALVVDDHGTTVGLVTLEDVVEEVLGDIKDEFDQREEDPIRHEGETVVVEGSASPRRVREELGVDLGEVHEATIGGHVVEMLGRVPEPGETVELDGYRVEVSDIDATRVTQLRFSRVNSEEGGEPEHGAGAPGS